MSGNKIRLKLFLKDHAIREARRVFVDNLVATSFLYLREKFETIFPILKNAQFTIIWRDGDGDDITVATDEDLFTALTEMSSDVKVFTIKIVQHPKSQAPVHGVFSHTILCDGCNKTISGFRYKCVQCIDYDLCSDCEFQGLHLQHVMVRLPNIESYSPAWGLKFVNHIARSLKRNAHHASKHAHRLAKRRGKHGRKYKPSDLTSYESDSDDCEAHPILEGFIFKERNDNSVEQDHLIQNACKNKEQSKSFDVLCETIAAFLKTKPSAPTESGPSATDNIKTSSENDNIPMKVNVTPAPPSFEPLNTTEFNANKSNNTNEKLDGALNQPPWTFVASPTQQPPSNVSEALPNAPPDVAFIYHENPTIAEGLVTLYEMGFFDENGVLTNLLEHFKGNVAQVIKAIVDK